ncbi:DUF362 domain-containing protein [Candidatus Latescibacterota bacterium]
MICRAYLVAVVLLLLASSTEAGGPFAVSVVPSDAPELASPVARDQALSSEQVEAMVRRAVDLLGGMGSVVPDTARLVVIKPNVGTDRESGSGINTDNRVVRGVALLVHEVAPNARILIAEGAGGWADPKLVEEHGVEVHGDMVKDGFALAGYRDLVTELQARGLDIDCYDLNFDDAPVRRVPGGGLARDEYEIAAILSRADAWINVPVAKTHGAKITCCMKNHFGILPGTVYGWIKSHGTDDHEGIPHAPRIVDEAFVDLWMLSDVDLNVADMIRSSEGGAFAGEPKRGNLIVAGRDPVATDLVVGQLMGFNPDDFEFAALAAQRGRGPGSIKGVEVVGAPVEALATRYKKAGVDYEGGWREQANYGMGPRHWTLLGPLSADEVPPPEAAAGYAPAPGQSGWSPVVWFGHDKVDLDRYYDDPMHCSVFAFTRFHMPESDSVRFWIGSDEGLQVWIDGRDIYSHEGRRKHHLGMEQVPGYVEAGEHRLLVRADQKRGRFSFSFNVCEPIDDVFYAGNRYPGVRYYLDESMPQPEAATRVKAEDVYDDWNDPFYEGNIGGADPVELARGAPDSIYVAALDTIGPRDLLGMAAAVAGVEAAHLDSTALTCLSAVPFALGYGGFHGWWPYYGPDPGRLMGWIGLRYDVRAAHGVRESLKSVKGWLATGHTPMVSLGQGQGRWSVATGYRLVDGTTQLHLVAADSSGWFDRTGSCWAQLPGGRWQQDPVVAVERAGPPLSAEALTDSMAALAVDLALTPWSEEKSGAGTARRFPAGLAGWDAWVIAWERAPFTPAWSRQATLEWHLRELREWVLPPRRDGRRRAAAYFTSAAGAATGERAELLGEAGRGYGEAADLLGQLVDLLPEKMGKALTDEALPQLEELRAKRSLVRQARDAERRAVEALSRLVGGPDLPPIAVDPLDRRDQGRRLATWQAERSKGVYDLSLRGESLEWERVSGREAEEVVYEVLAPVPETEGWELAVEAVRGVGRYFVLQQPTAATAWEAIIRVDDAWTGVTPAEVVIWAVPKNP